MEWNDVQVTLNIYPMIRILIGISIRIFREEEMLVSTLKKELAFLKTLLLGPVT